MGSLNSVIKNIRNYMRMDPGISGDAQRIEQISWLLFLKIYDAKESDWAFDDESYESIIPEKIRWRNWAKGDKSPTGDELLHFVNDELFPALKTLHVTASTPVRKSVVRSVFEDTNQYMKDGVQLYKVIKEIDGINFDSYEDTHAFAEIYEIFLRELQSAGSAGEFYTPRAVTDFIAEKINPQIGESCADFACGTGGFLVSWLKALEPKIVTSSDRELYDSSVHGIEKKQCPYILCVTNMLLHDIDSPDIKHGNSLGRNILDFTDKDRFNVIMMNPPYGGSEKSDIMSHFPKDLRSSETADLFMALIMYRLKQGGRAAVILPDGFLFGTDGAKLTIKSRLLQSFNLHTVIRMPASVFAPYTSITTNILFFDRTGKTRETWFYRLDMPEGYKNFSKTSPIKREHFSPVDEWWQDRRELQDDGGTYKSRKYSADEIEAGNYSIDLCGFPNDEKIILTPEETIQKFIRERERLGGIVDGKIAEIMRLLEVKE